MVITLPEPTESTVKDKMPQRGILDALLNQPTNTTPAELMRTTYNESCDSKNTTNISKRAPTVPMLPFQLKSILMEHCYARPSNWRPESHFLRPAKSLYMKEDNQVGSNINIDVCNVDVEEPAIYDLENAKKYMEESEKYVAGIRETEEFHEWEDKVPKIHWSMIQHNMFNSVAEILNADRMSRLAYGGQLKEAALRRTVIGKSVKRFRRLMAKYMWDVKLIQWLHSVLIEHLNSWYLSAYLDILQVLSQKLPTFVEKLMGDTNTHNRLSCLNTENLQKLVKRPGEPISYAPQIEKLKSVIGDPVIIIIPSATSFATNTLSKRVTRLVKVISKIGTTITILNSRCSKKTTIAQCVEQAIVQTRAQIQEVRADNSERGIILFGMFSGSAIALQVAQMESITGVVCFGFSIHTPTGRRGQPDDNIYDLYSPVLFIIGQAANTVLQENLEDIRERMNVETGLLVVGGADDYIRVGKHVKRREGVTQRIVDQCVIEEVYDFVNGLLSSPFPPQVRQAKASVASSPESAAKRPKIERKRNNSNGSSLDSEPPSPTPSRVSRPPSRPLTNKVIRKIDGKFYSSANVPSSPSSNSLTPPNPPSTPESVGDSTEYHMKTASVSDITTNAKFQGMFQHSGTLPHVKNPSGLKIIPSNPNKQIKVLESISIKPGATTKIIQPIVNRANLVNANYQQRMVVLADGTHKTIPTAATVRNNVASQLSKLLTSRHIGPGAQHAAGAPSAPPKFVTKGRPKVTKKRQAFSGTQPHLPPPANLSSQDILNLPIIFADDNQMLANNTIQPSDVTDMPTQPPVVVPSQIRLSGGQPKVMYVSKPLTVGQSKNVVRQHIITKRVPAKKLPAGAASAIKYMQANNVVDIDIEGQLDTNTIMKNLVPAAKPATMSSDIITNKIKQAIEEKRKD